MTQNARPNVRPRPTPAPGDPDVSPGAIFCAREHIQPLTGLAVWLGLAVLGLMVAVESVGLPRLAVWPGSAVLSGSGCSGWVCCPDWLGRQGRSDCPGGLCCWDWLCCQVRSGCSGWSRRRGRLGYLRQSHCGARPGCPEGRRYDRPGAPAVDAEPDGKAGQPPGRAASLASEPPRAEQRAEPGRVRGTPGREPADAQGR